MSQNVNSPLDQFARLDTQTAAERMNRLDPVAAAALLAGLPPARANTILAALSEEVREQIMSAAPAGTDWMDSLRYPEGSVGRLLEDPPAVFRSGTSVATAVDILRETIRQRMVTYLFVVDAATICSASSPSVNCSTPIAASRSIK